MNLGRVRPGLSGRRGRMEMGPQEDATRGRVTRRASRMLSLIVCVGSFDNRTSASGGSKASAASAINLTTEIGDGRDDDRDEHPQTRHRHLDVVEFHASEHTGGVIRRSVQRCARDTLMWRLQTAASLHLERGGPEDDIRARGRPPDADRAVRLSVLRHRARARARSDAWRRIRGGLDSHVPSVHVAVKGRHPLNPCYACGYGQRASNQWYANPRTRTCQTRRRESRARPAARVSTSSRHRAADERSRWPR